MAQSRSKRSLLLDVESLRVFREVVTQGGFTAASKTLGVTQPAVSLKIRRLEDRLGMKLILRDGHSLSMTAPGRDLLAHAEKIVEAHDRAVDQMRRSDLVGAVRLGCNGEVSANDLSAATSRFRRTHPHVEVAIRVDHAVAISKLLDDGEIDIALITLIDVDGAVHPDDEVWRRDELHLLQGIEADLDDEDPVPIITFGPTSLYHGPTIAILDAAGRAHRVAMEWNDLGGVKKAIETGLGVGLLSTRNVTERMKPWTGVGPIDLPESVFVMRSRSDTHDSEAIDALKGHLTKALAQSDLFKSPSSWRRRASRLRR